MQDLVDEECNQHLDHEEQHARPRQHDDAAPDSSGHQEQRVEAPYLPDHAHQPHEAGQARHAEHGAVVQEGLLFGGGRPELDVPAGDDEEVEQTPARLEEPAALGEDLDDNLSREDDTEEDVDPLEHAADPGPGIGGVPLVLELVAHLEAAVLRFDCHHKAVHNDEHADHTLEPGALDEDGQLLPAGLALLLPLRVEESSGHPLRHFVLLVPARAARRGH
mmetsp:Transcript_69399/g.196738  ORF Transcript_69399/g.196738 Transcript_69399/m.196738 type:complete len:220 (-) Transcript_69399:150-809(-)